MQSDKKINIGKVIGLHGIKGWLKILSFTSPPENIFNYQSLIISNEDIEEIFHIENSRKQGKKILMIGLQRNLYNKQEFIYLEQIFLNYQKIHITGKTY
jgi:ribosomal 30S subunit maturation factor RimM